MKKTAPKHKSSNHKDGMEKDSMKMHDTMSKDKGMQ
jgi:hypothetical protein